MTPRVLIADDSLTVRMDLSEAFEEARFVVELAATLESARAALAREIPDVLVLDIQFPDGDGLDLLRELRQAPATAQLPVVLLSTQGAVGERIRGLEAGATDYAGKPYDREYVVSRGRELVRHRAQPDDGGAAQVLVIEDSATFREQLVSSLVAAGYRVLASASGADGVRQAARARPAAIVVDGVLPDIDGPTVIQRIRLDPALRNTPCLLLTASLDRVRELGALAAGADAFLRKDDGLAVLLARLAALLSRVRPTTATVTASSVFGAHRVLAVDDSETYLRALAHALSGDGYDVALARSGEEALELVAIQPPDAILLDLVMPGWSGQETCRRIKASPAWREIPVLMLTAREDKAAMLDGIAAGADDYIAKSSDFEVIRARLRAQLRRTQFEAEHRRVQEELYQKEVEAARERAARELAENRAAFATELERKNRELEEFTSVASHDLQAPLYAVRRFAEELARDHASTLAGEALELVRSIEDAATRMSALIAGLLEYARTATVERPRERVALEHALDRALANLRADVEETHAVVTAEPLPEVLGDALQLTQLFQNLVGNALKYRRPGEAPRVRIACRAEEGAWVIAVSDEGIGFEPRHAERVFGIFKRLAGAADRPGTGIGLAICKKVVERHGGRIWAEAALDRGATFSFTLPMAREQPPEVTP